MKKIMILLGIVSCFSLSKPVLAGYTSETCGNGAGKVFIGEENSKKYCVVNKAVSWFTAYSWCADNEWRMPSWKSDCPNALTSESGEKMRPSTCPNLKIGYNAWFADTFDQNRSIIVRDFATANINPTPRVDDKGIKIICAME